MRKIIIIQHCQSEHHINNMSGGWTDTPLTDLGRKQAELIGLKLKKDLEGEAKACFFAQPGSISVLQENNYEQNVLRILNNTSHLSELK